MQMYIDVCRFQYTPSQEWQKKLGVKKILVTFSTAILGGGILKNGTVRYLPYTDTGTFACGKKRSFINSSNVCFVFSDYKPMGSYLSQVSWAEKVIFRLQAQGL